MFLLLLFRPDFASMPLCLQVQTCDVFEHDEDDSPSCCWDSLEMEWLLLEAKWFVYDLNED